jgi:ankyrin repeat protein
LHEPATILHHLAFFGKLNMVRFLIERGVNPTIKDFRYQSDTLIGLKINDRDQVATYLQQVIDLISFNDNLHLVVIINELDHD